MRIWPDTLPMASRQGMSLSPIDQSMRTDMEVGDPKLRRITFARRDMFDATLRMTDAEFYAFRAWFGDDAWSLSGDSDNLASGWTLNSSSLTLDADVGPDGQLCDRVVEAATDAFHGVTRNLGLLAGGSSIVVRATLKQVGRQRVRLQFIDSDGVGRYVTTDLTTGAVIFTSGVTSYLVKDRGNGWWRVEFVAPVGSGAGNSFVRIQGVTVSGATGYLGDGVSGFVVCEQQARGYTGADLHLPTDASGNATGAAGGSAWFGLAMPLGNGLTVKQCQFIGTYAAQPLTGLNWEVSVKMRVR